MGAIAMRIKGKKGLSAVQRGLAVLRKYGANAHLWLPGIGKINGQELGNYLASDGTASASLDNPIGLVLDQLYGQGALGANQLVSPGDFTSGAWQKATITPTGGVADPFGGNAATTLTAGAATSGLYQSVTAAAWLQSGMWIRRRTGAGVIRFRDTSAGNPQPLSVTGAWAYFRAPLNSTAGPYACVLDIMTAGDAVDVYAPTTQQVLGAPASQAITANKPMLRRGVINLAFPSIPTSVGGNGWSTVTPGYATAPNGRSATRYAWGSPANCFVTNTTLVTNVAGASYTGVLLVQGNIANSQAALRIGKMDSSQSAQAALNTSTNVVATGTSGADVSSVSSTQASLGNGWTLLTVTAAFANSYASSFGVMFTTSAANGDVSVTDMGLFTGTLTAQQILQCGGVPLTTSAAASSSGGNWGWQFLAANAQQMTMPLATGSNGVLFSAASTVSATWQGLIGSGGQTTGVPGIALALTNAFQPRVLFGSSSVANQQAVSSVSVAAGSPFVVSAQWGPSSQKLRLNGVQTASNTVPQDPTSGNTMCMGNFAPGGTDYCNGTIYGSAFINAASVPVSDIQAVERLLAVFAGPTGVPF